MITNREAYALILQRLTDASDLEARDIRDVLRLGAGDLGLPDGAVLTSPEGLPAERRVTYCALVDGIRLLGGGERESDPFRPVHSGAWEAVLATLVVEARWEQIRETADELRREEIRRVVAILLETRDVCADARLWEARTRLEKLL